MHVLCINAALLKALKRAQSYSSYNLFFLNNNLSKQYSLITMALTIKNKLFFMAVLVVGLCASQALSRSLHEATMNERHEMWMAKYGRVYKDNAEKERQFNIFKANLEFIESFNKAGNRSYKFSINEFADLTNEEFQASRNGYKRISNPRSAET